MASSAITRTSYKDRLAGIRRAAHHKQDIVQAPVLSTLAGAALAFATKKGFLPVAAFGMPTKGLAILVGGAVALNTRGQAQKLALEVAKAAGAIYGYEAVMSGSFVAGDDDDDEM